MGSKPAWGVSQRTDFPTSKRPTVSLIVQKYGGSSFAKQVAAIATGRELDMLLTAGERISMTLLAMAIKSLGQETR